MGWSRKGGKGQIFPSGAKLLQNPHFRISVIMDCASYVHLKKLFMRSLEITSRMSGFVSIGVGCVFVKKIKNSEIQISRIWAYHPNEGFWRPSKFRSSPDISMTMNSVDPRCWRSMHIYIGYLHPKNNFNIFDKNRNYKISSWVVYFYRAR